MFAFLPKLLSKAMAKLNSNMFSRSAEITSAISIAQIAAKYKPLIKMKLI